MIKKTLIASFATLVIATGAMAQNEQPAQNTPAAPEAESVMPNTDTANTPATGSMDYISQQQTGEWLASRMIGQPVENSTGENLGDINDVIVSENGEVVGAVIGVGGFLGIGEKNIAVPFEKISTAMKGEDESVVVLNATKEELQAAPDYTDLKGQPLSVTKRVRDTASETYKQAKDKASETYQQAKESVAGEEASEEVTTTQ